MRSLQAVAAAAALCALLPASAIEYSPVKIGGGGYVAGIVTSARSASGPPQVFFRTDVGGIYRLLNSSSGGGPAGGPTLYWKPLLMQFTYSERNWYGGESLAVGGNSTGAVYTSAGAYFEGDEAGASIWSSADAGDTWRMVSPVGWAVRAGSNNSTFRGEGERLAVHPYNGNILLYGSYLDGLWRTENAGEPQPVWTLVPCGGQAGSPLPCNNSDARYNATIGALSLLFDPSSPGGNTVIATYPVVTGAEACCTGQGGAFVSTDAGLTWTVMPVAPGPDGHACLLPSVNRLALSLAYGPGDNGGSGTAGSGNGAAVLPSPPGSTSVIWAATRAGLYRTDGSPSRTWTGPVDVSPLNCTVTGNTCGVTPTPAGSDRNGSSTAAESSPWAIEFAGLDVNPWDPSDVIALTHVDSGVAGTGYGLVRSTDGGLTWALTESYREQYSLPWWPASFMNNMSLVDFNWGGLTTNLKFSPYGPGQAWLGDSWNTWLATNMDATLPAASGSSAGGLDARPSFYRPDTNKDNSSALTYLQVPWGHEVVFVLSMAGPHAGPTLLTGTADLAGVVHQPAAYAGYHASDLGTATPSAHGLDAYPTFCWFGGPWGWGAEGVGIDYTEALVNATGLAKAVTDRTAADVGTAAEDHGTGAAARVVPARIVVAQVRAWPDSHPVLYTTEDGAQTWRVLTGYNTSYPASWPAGVAIGAWDANAIVVPVLNDIPLYTSDGGVSWAPVQGLPPFPYPAQGYSGNRYNMSRPLAADRPSVAPPAGTKARFYYHDSATGVFYRSTDGGATFQPTGASLPPSPRCDVAAHHSVSPAGGIVWVALHTAGLYLSTDAGASFQPISTVAVAHTVAVGAPLPGTTEPVVYIFGLSAADARAGTGDWRPYGSTGRGVTWTDLSSTNGFGQGNWPATLASPRQFPGMLVVGSFGTGALYANATDVLLSARG